MWPFKKKPEWIHGKCSHHNARKHRKKGNVQFVLWKAGEHGHKKDYWIDYDPYWWHRFEPGEVI